MAVHAILRMPLKFDHPDLQSENPDKRVAAIDYAITAAKEWKRTRRSLNSQVEADRNELTEQLRTTPSVINEDRVKEYGKALREIEGGIFGSDTWSDARLDAIVNQPGLTRTREILQELRFDRERWAERVGVDESATAPYRLLRGRHAEQIDGVLRIHRE